MSKIRLALAGLGVSALLLGGVMQPAMAAKSKVKAKSHKVIKQTSGRGGSASSGNAGNGGNGGNGGPVAVNNPGAGPITLICGPGAPGPVTCVFGPGGPASGGGAGGAGGASGAAVGGAGGANTNTGSNVDTNTNSGNAVSAG